MSTVLTLPYDLNSIKYIPIHDWCITLQLLYLVNAFQFRMLCIPCLSEMKLSPVLGYVLGVSSVGLLSELSFCAHV